MRNYLSKTALMVAASATLVIVDTAGKPVGATPIGGSAALRAAIDSFNIIHDARTVGRADRRTTTSSTGGGDINAPGGDGRVGGRGGGRGGGRRGY
jgi:hypothetical protein